MTEEGPGLARFYLPLTLAVLLLVILTLVVEFAAPARALPSFARQTGQPCGTCHTDFAGLSRTDVASRSTATPTVAGNIEQRFSRSTIR